METGIMASFCLGLKGLGFPKIRCTFLAVRIFRVTVFWGIWLGPPVLGTYYTYTHIHIHT